MSNPINTVGTDLSPAERKKRVHQLRIQHPARASVLALLERCLTDSGHAADPKCLFIGGDTGVGKSTLIRAFWDRHPRVPGEEVDRIPVLIASIPAVATTKGTASELLKALGDGSAHQGSLTALTHRLLRYLSDCGVSMVVLDEFQHVIDRESSRILARTADWLKSLLDESGLPLVLVGLPHSSRILDENPQLARRFPRRTILDRFGWDTPEKRAEFRMLLQLIDRHLPFPAPAGLDHPETAEWFYRRTQGTLGLVMTLVREAAELAIDRASPRMETQDLHAAWNQMHVGLTPPPASPSGGGSKRTRQPSVSEVLRT